MIRRRTAILLALGLTAPLAFTASAAGALDQDLVASTTAGPPGTSITVSSASCVATGDGEAGLDASLYVGTAPDQQVAASAFGEAGSVTLTIPDWVDPDQPAVIKASCYVYDDTTGTDDSMEYDAIDFDIEPGGGTPVQVRSYSRTELLAGQGIGITGSCGPTLPNAFVQAFIANGDPMGEGASVLAGFDFAEAEADGSFDTSVIASNASVYLSASFENDQLVDFSAEEEPLDVPPGDYTVYIACLEESGNSAQYLEPGTITITGAAPTDGIDLTQDANTRGITLAGSCAEGEVTGGFQTMSAAEFAFDTAPDEGAAARGLLARVPRRGNGVLAGHALPANAVRGAGGSLRALADEGFSEFAADPGTDGNWAAGDTVGFDDGVAIGIAYCGDPLADGYFYDPQGVVVAVEAPPVTVPTVPTTVAPAPPANAVPGTPTYAG